MKSVTFVYLCSIVSVYCSYNVLVGLVWFCGV
jgi:hypothetical protein